MSAIAQKNIQKHDPISALLLLGIAQTMLEIKSISPPRLTGSRFPACINFGKTLLIRVLFFNFIHRLINNFANFRLVFHSQILLIPMPLTNEENIFRLIFINIFRDQKIQTHLFLSLIFVKFFKPNQKYILKNQPRNNAHIPPHQLFCAVHLLSAKLLFNWFMLFWLLFCLKFLRTLNR